MNDRPAESLKALATDLSNLISGDVADEEKMKLLLTQFRFSEEDHLHANGKEEAPYPINYNSIGIWKKSIQDGKVYYERDLEKSIDWPLWANTHKISQDKDRKRIILLGESVARGYFYDPYYTVAVELEAIINNLQGKAYCEVVDLARTSISMDDLQHVGATCKGLDPDAVVIFAGNNWFPKLQNSITDEDYRKMYGIFRTGSFKGLYDFLETKFSGIIRSFLTKIADSLVKNKVPVVFIIPGFNLKDWRSDRLGVMLPWLPGNAIADWLEMKERAEQALENKDYGLMELAARQMTAIDPFNPMGHELLGQALIHNEKWEEARQALEACRDVVLVRWSGNNQPRCFGVIRKTVLELSDELGIKVVDSHALFSDLVKNGVPDRNLFLDYCHLTVEGIKVSMCKTAEVILPLLSGKLVSAASIKRSNIEPEKDVKSVAHFCAAIHNAHNDQPSDIIAYHCSQSVSLSPAIKDIMLEYVDFANRYSSTVLCESFEKIILSGKMRQYEGGFALRPPRWKKMMDIKLVDATIESLQKLHVDMADHVNKLRKQEHSIHTDKVNLLESFYSSTTYREFKGDLAPGFQQVRSTENDFSFVTDGTSTLLFEIVYRTPKRFLQGRSVEICINDKKNPVASLPMSKKWITCSFVIDQKLLKDGLNKLIINWPYSSEPLEAAESIVSPNSFLNALLPVLGEIHSLTAVVK